MLLYLETRRVITPVGLQLHFTKWLLTLVVVLILLLRVLLLLLVVV